MERIITTTYGPVRLEAVDSSECKAYWKGDFIGIIYNGINADEKFLIKNSEYIIKVVFNS